MQEEKDSEPEDSESSGESSLESAQPRRTRAEVDARVHEIADLMRSGQWVRGRSRKVLAERWNVPVSTVAGWAAQASRLAWDGQSEDDKRELVAETIGRLGVIALKAEQAKRYGEATQAYRTANEVAGTITNVTKITINQVLASPVQISIAGQTVVRPVSELVSCVEQALPGDALPLLAAGQKLSEALVRIRQIDDMESALMEYAGAETACDALETILCTWAAAMRERAELDGDVVRLEQLERAEYERLRAKFEGGA